MLTRDVEIGSPVSSILNLGANATLVMTLGDIEQVFVRGKVDEADIGRVRLGQPARIRVETFKDKMFDGKVTQISPMGVEKDNVTNFEVRVSIDNPGKELKANMTANAEIVLEEHPNSLIVPEAAITYDAQKHAFVDVADPGAEDRPPEVAGQARRRQRHQDPGARGPESRATRSSCRRSVDGAASTCAKPITQSFENLRANKLRSFLTMFGILWGMISIVVLSAMGEGFRRGNDKVLREFGKNIGIVWGGRTSMQAGGERAGRLICPDRRRCARDRRRVVDGRRGQPGDPARRRAGQERLQRRVGARHRHRAAVPGHPHDRARVRPAASPGGRRAGGARRRSSAATWPSSCSASGTSSARRSRSTACPTPSSAGSGRRTRTATTAGPTTTRSSCRSRR